MLNQPAVRRTPRSWWPGPTSAPAPPASTPLGAARRRLPRGHRSRFADIFRNNSTKAGLLTVVLPQDAVEALWAAVEADPATQVTVDLQAKQVGYGDVTVPFDIDDYTRWRLLEGLDDVGLTERNLPDIEAFEAQPPVLAAARAAGQLAGVRVGVEVAVVVRRTAPRAGRPAPRRCPWRPAGTARPPAVSLPADAQVQQGRRDRAALAAHHGHPAVGAGEQAPQQAQPRARVVGEPLLAQLRGRPMSRPSRSASGSTVCRQRSGGARAARTGRTPAAPRPAGTPARGRAGRAAALVRARSTPTGRRRGRAAPGGRSGITGPSSRTRSATTSRSCSWLQIGPLGDAAATAARRPRGWA